MSETKINLRSIVNAAHAKWIEVVQVPTALPDATIRVLAPDGAGGKKARTWRGPAAKLGLVEALLEKVPRAEPAMFGAAIEASKALHGFEIVPEPKAAEKPATAKAGAREASA